MIPIMKGSLLFVYGTMLQKGRNHPRLYQANAIFLGEAQTVSRFRMYLRHKNGAPIAVPDAGGDPICGEVYAVLDEHIENIIDPQEGHPDLYCREDVIVIWLGSTVLTQMYVFPHEPGSEDRRVLPKEPLWALAYDP